jgi:cytidylate kinase
MGTVTIAATYGAGGSVVAPAVAQRLGLPMLERAIPASLAAEMVGPLTSAVAEDEGRIAGGGRLSRIFDSAVHFAGLYVGIPPPADAVAADEQVAQTEALIREAADRGGAVVLGRAAVFVLAGRADTLHVRLDGPVERRRAQAARFEGLDADAVAQRQRDADTARDAYVRHFHPGLRWDDPRHYHLVLDSTVISLEACADLVAAAARDLFSRSAPPPSP